MMERGRTLALPTFVVVPLIVALLACSSGGGAVPPVGQVIGANGGTVTGPDGSQLIVPAGAIDGDVRFSIAKDSSEAAHAPFEDSFRVVSSVFSITPHGHVFALPARVTLPIDSAQVSATTGVVVLKAQPFGTWRVLGNTRLEDSSVSVDVDDLSVFVVATRIAPQPEGKFDYGIELKGTAPYLTVTHRFSGTRPNCTQGELLETVFGYVHWNTWGTNGFPPSGGQSTTVNDQLASVVSTLPPPPAALGEIAHPVLQPMVMPHGGGCWGSSCSSHFYYPYVYGRYTCIGERAGVKTSAPWTQVSGGRVSLADSGDTVVLLADMPELKVVPGVPTRATVQVQIERPEWDALLMSRSRWEISRDQGATWSRLASPDRVTAEALGFDAAMARAVGMFRLEAALPAFAEQDHGALIRVAACIPFGYVNPTEICATGSAKALSVVANAVAPFFSTHPASKVLGAGSAVTLEVVAEGFPRPQLQWQRRPGGGDWADVAGATSNSLDLASTTFADDGLQFRVLASNVSGTATSNVATLNVVDQALAPTITSVSGDLTVTAGQSAVFSATVRGAAPLSYQWKHNGAVVAGASAPTLRLDNVASANAGSYLLEVSGFAGSAVSPPMVLTVLTGPPSVSPTIVTQPAAASTIVGQVVTFAVVATGQQLRYQWTRNGAAITGATSASYTTPVLTLSDDGSVFAVIVYNAAGLAVSQGALLTVRQPMVILAGHFVQGGGGGAADGVGTAARFDTPEGLVADAAGNLYVAQSNAGRVARIGAGAVVTSVLTGGANFGSLAVAPDGSLYASAISWCGLHRISSPAGASPTSQSLTLTGCTGSETRGVAVDATGVVYLSFVDANGVILLGPQQPNQTYPGTVFVGAPNSYTPPGSTDATGTNARFRSPRGLAFSSTGDLFIADTGNHTIRRVTSAGVVTTFAGSAGQAGTVDGAGGLARFYRPSALAFDSLDNLVVLQLGDAATPEAVVRRISPAGAVSTLFNARDEAVALATSAEAPFASTIRGLAVLDDRRIAITAGNAVLVRTLP